MKIDRSLANLPGASPPANTGPAGKALQPEGAAKDSATQVRISPQVQALGVQLAGADSSFDAKKVQSIRTAIAEGRFEVNVDHVADSLLTSVSDLIRAHARKA